MSAYRKKSPCRRFFGIIGKKSMLKNLEKSFFSKILMIKPKAILIGLAIVIFLFSLGAASDYFYFNRSQFRGQVSPEEENNVEIEFLSEVYNTIKQNYWDNLSDAQMSSLFRVGAENLVGGSYNLKSNDLEGLKKMYSEILARFNEAQKKEFSTKLTNLVLTNLSPQGRSNLYTQSNEKSLQNTVQNKNPEADLYQNFGISKDATENELKDAYSKKAAEIKAKKEEPSQKQTDLEKLDYAYGVLSDKESRAQYDESGAEPTVFYKLLKPEIFYIYIKIFSPATFSEFQRAANSLGDIESVNTLILDLRGNIGGSIDILPYFLGPFIGQDQFAYEFLHRGERIAFKTKTGWLDSLVRYKQVVILVDSQTQSTAELLATVLKKYNVGVVVGEKTRGWGTVEKVFEIKQQIDPAEKYSLFLTHSLTLRDDNQPIEGNGVEPIINLTSENWENQLYNYFRHPQLDLALKDLWKSGPISF